MTRQGSAERGMVTIELAVGLVLAMVMTICLVGLSLLGVAQAACAESSAQLARQAARGDDQLLKEARERAPEGASIELTREADGVLAVVSLDRPVPLIGTVTVSAEAWSPYEPGVEP